MTSPFTSGSKRRALIRRCTNTRTRTIARRARYARRDARAYFVARAASDAIPRVYRRSDGRVAYVSISDADRDPELHYAATVYHGIALAEFPPRERPGRGLASLGRIHPDKGVAEAIAVARAVDLPLVIAGIVQDREYFEREVAPHLDGERVRYVGSLGSKERDELLGSAIALLHLVEFAEPFGLSMIEAMACGTPVIGRRRGAVAEGVDH